MFNKLKKTDNNKGFTIIEVMIVLAIAGLILLIVFLAVPALQRSSRNTARKSDAGHIGTAVNDFISNNSGQAPGGVAGAYWSAAAVLGGNPDCTTILKDAGTLNQYNTANQFNCNLSQPGFIASPAGQSTANANFEESHLAITTNAVTGQAMILDVAAKCPATNTNSTVISTQAAAGNNINQDALLYTTEPASGQWPWTCTQIQ